jgi:hypothetical protein
LRFSAKVNTQQGYCWVLKGGLVVRLAESYSNSSVVKTFDKEYDIVGTVKEHSEYNKVRQTVLTRCKIKGE